MSKIDRTLRRIRQELAAVRAPALPAQPVHGGGMGGDRRGPFPFIYPIFQVSPDTRSLAMSPVPRADHLGFDALEDEPAAVVHRTEDQRLAVLELELV